MLIILWLDDARDPSDKRWASFLPKKPFDEIVWAQSYEEFVNWISANGLPSHICFDHDINSNDVNGVDACKWLIQYCMDNECKLPSYSIHTANIVGGANMRALLKCFGRSQNL
jgi:hypothetical protein